MSWHYSQALVAAYSAANCSAGEPCAPLNSTPTPEACSWPGKTTAALSPSPSGTTCEPSTASLGEAVLTWFLEAFPARTSAPPAKGPASAGPAADSGEKWPASFAKQDRATSSWKTPQCSLLAGLDEFSEIWPRWGLMRAGECSEQSMPAHLTSETESGSWPTPRSTDGDRGGRGDLIQAVRGNPNSHYRLWPTPTVFGNYNRKGVSANSGDGLATALKMWPTPTVQDSKNNGAPSQMERNTKPLNAEVGGALNPPWVEWLMGWPIGWTDCAASATDKFRQWCDSHGTPSPLPAPSSPLPAFP